MANRSDDRDGSDDVGSDEVSEGDSTAAKGSKGGRIDRIRSSVQSANLEPGRSDIPTKWSIDRLDEREKRFSFAAAGGSALFGVLIYLLETNNSNFRLSKGQFTPQTILIFGLVAASLLLATTFIGRRAPVGFVALFTFLVFSGSALFLGLPFLALAVWLLFRSYKIQRAAAANLRAANAEVKAGRTAASRAAPAAPRSKAGGRTTGPARPEANKRFTPKQPPPPRPPAPKLSRKERKAAEAKD
jgi:hypothetical protein